MIENRLEEHERHPVEPYGVVEEPAPGQARVLAAAEAICLRAGRIAVIEVSLDRVIASGDLQCPVGDCLAVHPLHDFIAGIVSEWCDETRLSTPPGLRVFGR